MGAQKAARAGSRSRPTLEPMPSILEESFTQDESFTQEVSPSPRTMRIPVPANAEAGTQLGAWTPDGQELTLTVPEGLAAGWCLVLTQDPETSKWRCSAEPPDEPEVPQAAPAPACAKDGPDRVSIVVPEGAVPGTELPARTPDGKELTLTVPEGVPAGSRLVLTRDPGSGKWACTAELAETLQPPTISVVVPEGATPGTRLTQRTPDGQELDLTVPDGVHPGTTLTLTQDPSTKRWSCAVEQDPTAQPPEPASSSPSSPASSSSTQSVSVVVPADAVQGTMIHQKTPDGADLDLMVPEGVAPGSVLVLTKDSATNRWICTGVEPAGAHSGADRPASPAGACSPAAEAEEETPLVVARVLRSREEEEPGGQQAEQIVDVSSAHVEGAPPQLQPAPRAAVPPEAGPPAAAATTSLAAVPHASAMPPLRSYVAVQDPVTKAWQCVARPASPGASAASTPSASAAGACAFGSSSASDASSGGGSLVSSAGPDGASEPGSSEVAAAEAGAPSEELASMPEAPPSLPAPDLQPVYCCQHLSSKQRPKGESRLRECAECRIVVETNYKEFELCITCSHKQNRCMVCGATDDIRPGETSLNCSATLACSDEPQPDAPPPAVPQLAPGMVPPRYCVLHCTSAQRTKAQPKMWECEGCGMEVQTNYSQFKYCAPCSEKLKRCMLCGADAPDAGTYVPSTTLRSASSSNLRSMTSSHVPAQPGGDMDPIIDEQAHPAQAAQAMAQSLPQAAGAPAQHFWGHAGHAVGPSINSLPVQDAPMPTMVAPHPQDAPMPTMAAPQGAHMLPSAAHPGVVGQQSWTLPMVPGAVGMPGAAAPQPYFGAAPALVQGGAPHWQYTFHRTDPPTQQVVGGFAAQPTLKVPGAVPAYTPLNAGGA